MEQPDTRDLVLPLEEIEQALAAGHFLVARAQAPSTQHLDARALNVDELPAILKFHEALQPVINKHTTGRLLSFVVVYKNQVVFPIVPRRTGQLELGVGPSLTHQLQTLAADIESRAQDRHVRNAGSQSAAGGATSTNSDVTSKTDPGLECQEDSTNRREVGRPAPQESFKLQDKLIDVLAKNPEVRLGLSDNAERSKSIEIPTQAELQRAPELPKVTSTVITGLVGSYDAVIGGIIIDGRQIIRDIPEDKAAELVGKNLSFTVSRVKESIRLSVFDWNQSAHVEQGHLDL